MRATLIEELKIASETRTDIRDRLVAVQVDLFVLDRAPEPLDEDVVAPAAFAVHADLDLSAAQHVQEFQARELAALIGVEDLRAAVPRQRIFQRRDAEVARKRWRQAPAQHLAARPVHHDDEVDEAAGHRNVGYVRRPDVIRTCHGERAQEIGKDRMRRVALGRPRPLIDGGDADASHERAHVLPPDRDAVGAQEIAQHPTAREGQLEVQRIEPTHQREVGLRHGLRCVVDRSARKPQQLRLPGNR